MTRYFASWAYSRWVLPTFDRAKCEGLAGRLQRYERLERLSLNENKHRQWAALLQILEHAYNSSPFYRHRFDSIGLQPSDIRCPEDLKGIPPLTRADIRDHLSELSSRRYRPEELRRSATGGTTDTPVPFLADVESMREKMAVQMRFQGWAGFLPGDKVFYLWGARSDFTQNPSWRWQFFERYLMRRHMAPTSLLNQEVLESYRRALNSFRPRIVYAYPTPLALFCEYLHESRRPYHRPARTICTAEPILAHQRAVIEQVLDCPLFEHYGTRDCGMIAAECERHQGLHLNPAAVYVEYLPMEGAEVEGMNELLVTDLLNYGMPLIRYRINDCTVEGSEVCPCGRGYPLLQQIVGRTTDIFYLPNGDVVPGISLHRVITEDCPGLRKIQIIQETHHNFRLRFVPGTNFIQADLGFLQNKLDERFGKSIHWTFERVEEIEREASGKTKFCISHVAELRRKDAQPVEQMSR